MPNGYWGRILRVDLSSGQVAAEILPDELYRQYLGGYGLGVRLLYDRIPAGADPLGPDNVLALTPGLLTGSGAPFSGRWMAAGKSPLTGGWADANAGGKFGVGLRGAGYDAILVRGVSEKPLYLYVDNKQAELRDATALWGLDTVATEEALQRELGNDVRVACIGPAGEKRSLISGIVNDGGRIAARGGLGAVMGSKGLKAVVVRGKQALPIADAGALKDAGHKYREMFKTKPLGWLAFSYRLIRAMGGLLGRLRYQYTSAPLAMTIDSYRRYGTASGTMLMTILGDTPVKNWSGTSPRDFTFEQASRLSDEAVIRNKIRPYACQNCPLGCGAIIRLPDGGTGHRPEYETLASFGSMLLNDDLDTVVACQEICNRAGLDTISTGGAVAFAIECAKRGLLPPALAGELDLHWGDQAGIVELTRRIAERRPGLGDWLADGVARASAQLGAEAQSLAIHAGGQELPMHRGLYEPLVAVGYQVDPAPGRHTATNCGLIDQPAFTPYLRTAGIGRSGRYDYARKGPEAAAVIRCLRIVDCLGLCQFGLVYGDPPYLAWLRATTGWAIDETELYETGGRIQRLRHAFNAREGIRPQAVTLPARERGTPPMDTGPLAGLTLDMQKMVQGYYEAMGVNPETGWPKA